MVGFIMLMAFCFLILPAEAEEVIESENTSIEVRQPVEVYNRDRMEDQSFFDDRLLSIVTCLGVGFGSVCGCVIAGKLYDR